MKSVNKKGLSDTQKSQLELQLTKQIPVSHEHRLNYFLNYFSLESTENTRITGKFAEPQAIKLLAHLCLAWKVSLVESIYWPKKFMTHCSHSGDTCWQYHPHFTIYFSINKRRLHIGLLYIPTRAQRKLNKYAEDWKRNNRYLDLQISFSLPLEFSTRYNSGLKAFKRTIHITFYLQHDIFGRDWDHVLAYGTQGFFQLS